MDDKALIRTYGNTNLPEGTADRPLITFALFAYNQEKFIREAVEGAFSQTYSPLEIILSDDCSSDRTLEIMEEMAREYRGPHLVKVRRGEKNAGTLNHVLQVSQVSAGEYIAVAAGDDISKPTRINTSISMMLADKIEIASFGCEEIGDDDSSEKRYRNAVTCIQDKFLVGAPELMQIHGASACYKRTFLESIPRAQSKILLEDYVFQIIAFWTGARIDAFDASVLQYRVHEGNIGPKQQMRGANQELYENSVCQHYSRIIDALDYLSKVELGLHVEPESIRVRHHGVSGTAIRYASIRSRWPDLSLKERIWLVKFSRRFNNPRRDLMRALGPRIYFAITRFFQQKPVSRHLVESRR